MKRSYNKFLSQLLCFGVLMLSSFVADSHNAVAPEGVTGALNTEERKKDIQEFLKRVLQGLRSNTIKKVIQEEIPQQPQEVKKAIENMLKAAFALYPSIDNRDIQVLRLITQGLPKGAVRAPLSIRGEPGLLTLEFTLKNNRLELSDVFVGNSSKAQELGIKK